MRFLKLPHRFRSPVFTFVLGLILAGCSHERIGAGREPQSSRAGARITASERTALDDYIARPDTNYSYQIVTNFTGQGQTTYVVEMTSQAWLTTNEVDRPLWKHWLLIVKPDEVRSSNSLLFINGGANDGKVPKSADGNLVRIAVATKSVVADLKMVPNQPLVFAGETEGRKEDSLIAYTWDKFLRTGDTQWPARLPMTKAAVRAMDTVTAFCGSAEGGNIKVDGFVVAGGSKRGWTTWTTAAVDKRVVAIMPCVIDLLNVEPSMLHHYAAYGFWAPAVGDYTRFGIMDWMGTPENRTLMKIEEPYEYRQRYTMPKFIINAAGDQFFLPDSSQFYFKDLPGVKYLRYIPNTDHSLRGSDAYETLLACYHAIINQVPPPKFSWTVEEGLVGATGKDGSSAVAVPIARSNCVLRVTAKDRPSVVKLWQATNPDARDFRLETLGPRYESTTLSDSGGGVYIGTVPKPEKGWTAFFVELTFPSGCQAPFKFTTQVCVVPDTLPYEFVPKGRPQ